MDSRVLLKPDGRRLRLYARDALTGGITAPSPSRDPHAPSPHLRWHPLRGEWVAYAAHRQNRTFLPPADFNPLAITTDASKPTELPAGNWDVAVFDNLFPTLAESAGTPPDQIVPTLPGRGSCEVVVFTQDASTSLGNLPLSHLKLVIDVWAERYEDLGRRNDVAYVFPFENRGVEVGVTLHHPHGQIYAYPFVPPIAARELEQQRLHFEQRGTGLLQDLIAAEMAAGMRLLYASEHAVALMPVCARYPYEMWVAPIRPASSFSALSDVERVELARALKTVLLKLDGLWQRTQPYVLVVHQAPTDGRLYPESHLHIEIYPAYRMPNRLKYLAGSEIGAGVFTSDTLPEEKVKELQAVAVSIGND